MAATTLIDRSVIRLSGVGVRAFLQGLVTNDMTGPLPVWAGLLTPQGKALFDFIVWDDGDDILIDCEAQVAGDLIRRLSMYRLRLPIAIAVDPSLAVHWVPTGAHGVADPRMAALGRRCIAPPGEPAQNWLAHRLGLGVTEGRDELGDGTTLWLECNARELNGVSFTKGCYVGQENTARMHHRAKVNRQLRVVPASTDPGQAARIWYPALSLAIVHQRTDASDGSLEP